ncbi:unnamed protein product [Rodentolepis nana]|uniref:BACK domain-containing protein n=1 Tax=Rodentolepis nana TaxID=102285 RepID=A0A0R3T924_RODNA|nr:unnamed protein product [Rodentolepis nana]
MLIECFRRRDIDDLALAVHYCHIGQCKISIRIECDRVATPPVKRREEESSLILLSTNQLRLTPTMAECSLTCGLRVASTYGIENLHQQCIQYLKANLNIDSCWDHWKSIITSSKQPTTRIIHQVDKTAGEILLDFMQEKFRKFTSEIFLQELKHFSCAELELILASNKLNVRSEIEVIKIIETWIQAQQSNNNPDVGKFLSRVVPRLIQSCVRFELLEIREIDRLLQLPGMQTKSDESRSQCVFRLNHQKRKLIRETRNLRSLSNQSGQNERNPPKDSYRIPHEAIVVFGGWEGDQPSRRVRVLDTRQKVWKTYDTDSRPNLLLPHPLMSFAIANIKNEVIYIAGGESRGGQATQEVLRYEIKSTKSGWKGCAPMHDIRRDFVLVNYRNKTLYSIGGDNNREVLDSVEALPLENGNSTGWLEVASMIIPRAAAAGDVVGPLIYVCGGYTESRMESLTNSCESYNPDTNQWTLIQPMSQPRYFASAVAFQNHLFVLGGGGDSNARASTSFMTMGYGSTVERLTPGDGTWELMPPISERADFATCILEDEIYCIGGGGETFCTGSVESWKPWVGSIRRIEGQEHHQQIDEEISVRSNTSSPIWMALADTEDETDSRSQITANSERGEHLEGWHKGVQLPQSLWGHRAVTISGVDKVIHLLGIKVNQRSKTPFRAPDRIASQQWRIKKIGDGKVLSVMNTTKPTSKIDDEAEDVTTESGEVH